MTKHKSKGPKKPAGTIHKLLVTLQSSHQQDKVLHLTTPDQTVKQMLNSLSKRFQINCIQAYKEDAYQVDPEYRIGDSFTQDEHITVLFE